MTLAAPVLRLALRLRAGRGREIAARLGERRGIDPARRPPGQLIWLHAASVGEVVSLLPVLSAIAALSPDTTTLLTTGTVTSAGLLEQRLPQLGLAGRVRHRFVPLDVPAWVARFLDHWRPDAVGFVESELWPNILTACHDRDIPVMLINARMSRRSFNSWSRVPWAARFVLGRFARVFARGEEDAARLRALGAPNVEVRGDLKLAAPILPADPGVLRDMADQFGDRPVFLAASTHPGEEILIREVHDALAARHPGLLTIVAPRHPDRGPDIAKTLQAPSRQLGEGPPDGGIWIADTMGELGLWYRLCHVAFVGRSLIAPGGGQNPLEPARLGCVVATGPHTGNFTEHVALLRGAGALEVVADVSALVAFADTMLSEPDRRTRMGERAAEAVKASGNVPDETARALLALAAVDYSAADAAVDYSAAERASGP